LILKTSLEEGLLQSLLGISLCGKDMNNMELWICVINPSPYFCLTPVVSLSSVLPYPVVSLPSVLPYTY
jgi:hypothetical protein